jgi:hypothetical protein
MELLGKVRRLHYREGLSRSQIDVAPIFRTLFYDGN